MHRLQGKQVANARIDRMVREINSEPSAQFFQSVFGLFDQPAKPKAEQHPVPSFQRVQGGAT